MTDLFKITQPFDSFEVSACFPLGGGEERVMRKGMSRCDASLQRAETKHELEVMQGIVYTVYGFREGLGSIAIGDFADAETARAVAEALAMTRRDVPVVDLIPDGHAPDSKKREDEGPRWVLEHELEPVTS